MNKKVVVLGILAICLLISIGIGFSYALWNQTEKQSSPNVVQSGCFSISLNGEDDINIPNGYPITDDKGKKQTPYTFTITNTCSIYASYSVNLEKLTGSTMDGQYVKVMLDNKDPKLYSEYKPDAVPTDGASESKTLTTGGLNPQGSITYELRLWIDYSGTNETVGGKTFQTRIIVSATAAEQETYCTQNAESPLCSDKSQLAFDDPGGNLRFIGQDPHNYVTFNDEVAGWRIIGVFNDMWECPDDDTDVTTGTYTQKCQRTKLLKLIRKDRLPSALAWDSSNVNDWSKASLMTFLNSGDYSKTVLNNDAKNMIARTVWNLGGLPNMNGVLAEQYYTAERSDTVYSENPNKWIGIVGLMYPSDYGFATGGGASGYDRNSCLAKELFKWNTENYKVECAGNDWLWDNATSSWTLTPESANYSHAFYVALSGHVNYYDNGFASNKIGVRPVVYLKSDVQIMDGSGEEENPYQLSL